MSSSSTPKFSTPVVVNTDDLTLAELDRAGKLTSNGEAGNLTSLAFVYLKREHPSVRLADVEQLRSRDVIITDDSEQAQGDEADAVDPTH